MREQIRDYNDLLDRKDPHAVITFFMDRFREETAFSTSLGAEDQVLTDIICRSEPGTRIFTLDTGRLFQETYDLLHITEQKYGIEIRVLFPDYKSVEKMVGDHGINLFYESIEKRQLCCGIRKIEPLKRALTGVKVWLTGLRREQSVTRKNMRMVEWDDEYQVIKVSPLIDWSEEQVWEYIHKNKIPYNELHDKGYPSIGCLPCTRAVLPGESVRSGRWWWENPENKECGLH